jgi:hypothetical protein
MRRDVDAFLGDAARIELAFRRARSSARAIAGKNRLVRVDSLHELPDDLAARLVVAPARRRSDDVFRGAEVISEALRQRTRGCIVEHRSREIREQLARSHQRDELAPRQEQLQPVPSPLRIRDTRSK